MVDFQLTGSSLPRFLIILFTLLLAPLWLLAQNNKKVDLAAFPEVLKTASPAKTDSSTQVRILTSDHQSLTIEITIPELEIDHQSAEGSTFHVLHFPGFTQRGEPGEPLMPVKGFLFGIPPGAKPSLEILDFAVETLSGITLLPAAKIETRKIELNHSQLLPTEIAKNIIQKDEASYSANKFYPPQIAQVGESALFRDLSVSSLQIFPVQFNPVLQQIRYYKKMKIKINFLYENQLFSAPLPPNDSSPPFENIFKHSLLNDDVARNWKPKASSKQKASAQSLPKRDQNQEVWYKIFIEIDGVYRITFDLLAQAGINPSLVQPEKIRIFNLGKEIAIFVHGQEDGIFDQTDYIEFYGSQAQNDYTYANVYWLTFDNTTNGKRMAEKDGKLSGTAPTLIRAKEKVHFEQEKYFSTSIPNGEGVDHWFWNYIIAPDSLQFTVNLNHVAQMDNNDCLFKTEYRGYTDTEKNPDHHTIASLNGYKVLDDYWDGRIKFEPQAFFPQDILQEGENSITIQLPGDTGSETDVHYINYFEIEYWRDFIAQQDSLLFWGEGNGNVSFEIKNFSSNQIELFDISDKTNLSRLLNFSIEPDGNKTTLLFEDELNGKNRYYALTDQKIRFPNLIIADETAELHSSSNQADYIIITHEDFFSSSASLANFRASQGLTIKTVKITDIYDEFNYGIKNPQAIKDFLSYAFYYWQQPAPSFVLLVGDASNDFKDFLNTRNLDYVPTHLFESRVYNTFTSSDNWFVCVNGDDNLPDMLIGRLPARTVSEAEVMVNKIINYETNMPQSNWNDHVLFIADNADSKGNYRWHSDYLADNFVPQNFAVHKAYLDDFKTADSLRKEIFYRLNQGCLMANYFGHGGVDFWAGEKIFSSKDVASLDNYDTLPFLVSLSCLNGYFQHPAIPYCLAEEFVKASNGGAIACYSPSGFADTYGLQIIGEGLCSSLFGNQNDLLGSIIAQSKIDLFKFGSAFLDHIEFYNLFGDPAVHLKLDGQIAIPPSVYSGNIILTDQPAPLGSTLSGWLNNLNCPANFSLKTPGKFGPMYLSGDNPNTPLIEGGVNGDSVRFKLVTASHDTFPLAPTSIWESGIHHHVDLFVAKTSVKMASPISITILVNDKIVGQEILDGDPIPTNSIIRFKLKGDEAGISSETIQLKLNKQIQSAEDYSITPQLDPLHEVEVEFNTATLSDGRYDLMIEVSNLSNPAETRAKNYSFQISSRLHLDCVLNYPNPMQTTTVFTYYLFNSEPAAVSIKIYNVAGKLIKTIDGAAGEVGYNESYWDGRDSANDEIANGVYFYKISAKEGSRQFETVERLVKMK